MNLTTFRERFDPHLRRFLLAKSQQFAEYSLDPTLAALLEEPSRLLNAGGKRLRPLMAWAGFRLAGGTNDEAAMKAVVALELFHAFALVHDDIMDRGTERHGVPTVHVAVTERLSGRTGDLAHVGVSQAIILGDLLFSWALEVLTAADVSPDRRQAALQLFFRMSDEVMVGQMMDIDVTTRDWSTMAEMEQKMALKTAGYTFTRPLQLGMALAAERPELAAFAEAFGRALGVAFQILDDIQDSFADHTETGKTPLSDIRDRQQTLLTQWVAEHGSDEDRAAVQEARGLESLTDAQINRVREAFVRSGAFVAALDACRSGRERAERALAECACSEDDRLLLQLIIDKAVPLDVLDRRAKAVEIYGLPT
jgi:geranylgeranyl diphosphate synthase type I